MLQNNPGSPENRIKLEVQEDTEERMARFQQMRRNERIKREKKKVKFEIRPEKREEKKELRIGKTRTSLSDVFQPEENLGIVLVLGFTLALVNDFSDLVTWQSPSLIAQTLDMTLLILLLFILVFGSRAYFLSVVFIVTAFLLEALPISGVLPWWTIGMAVWYLADRKKS